MSALFIAVKRTRWTIEEIEIFNQLHPDTTKIPDKDVMAKLCAALPTRTVAQIRARAHNLKK